DHPYWKVIQCDMSGPVISSSYPDVGDYMNDYARDRQTVSQLVYALAAVAFPHAKECSGDEAPAPAPAAPAAPQPAPAAPAQDPIEQLKKYKQLMEDGVIDADEFAAKKKQLLGL
ncbi:MAG: SHOCT domain-containing protein, partial [Pseudoflavonifractor sp.]